MTTHVNAWFKRDAGPPTSGVSPICAAGLAGNRADGRGAVALSCEGAVALSCEGAVALTCEVGGFPRPNHGLTTVVT